MSGDESFCSAVWNDPRSTRVLTVTLAGGVLIFQGASDFSHDLSPAALVLGAFLSVPVAVFLLLKRREASTLRSLAEQASTTEGRVTVVKKSFLTGGYVLRYRFEDSVGQAHEGTRALDQRSAFMWRVGDKGAVRFDPHNPSKSVWIGRGVGFHEDGRIAVAPGTVVDVTHKELDGKKTVVVRYRFRDHVGATHDDQFRDDKDAGYKPGDIGEVEFAPRHPQLNFWRGKSSTRSTIGEAAQSTASSPREIPPCIAAHVRPSTATLIRQSKYLKRAILHGVYVFIGASFWVVSAVWIHEQASDAVYTLSLALFIGVFLFWFVWNTRAGIREVTESRRLLTVGTPARGTVTLVEEQVLRSGFWTWRYGWEASYRYRDQHGRAQTGRSGYHSRREAANWRIGDECTVLYDPNAPDKSLWIGTTRSGAP